MKTLLLLGGGIESLPILRRARELGLRAVVADGNPQAAAREWADEFLCASCYHAEQVIHALKAQPDGILCAAVDAPRAAAEVRAVFGLPGLSMDAANLSQKKALQKAVLSQADLPIPIFAIVEGPYAKALAPNRETVIKPDDSRGGRGVIRLLPGVDTAWAYAVAKHYSPTGRVLAEQWLTGPQLSTESIIQSGRVLFTAIGLRNYVRLDEFAPYCIEDGFDEPYGAECADEINSLVQRACAALAWDNSTVKGDLVIHQGRVYIIELAARLSGGFFATHGHPLAYGVDFVGAAIRLALGETVDVPKPETRQYVSQRYVFPERDNIGRRVLDFTDLPVTTKQGFHSWAIRPGDILQPVDCHPRRLGQVIAVGETPEQAQARAERAVREMKVGLVLQ